MKLKTGFRLGPWTVLPLESRLQRGTDSIRVQPRSMDVLLCLAEAGGAVVEREDLLRQVWGKKAVNDEPLTRCVGELRKALGDKSSNPEYILTVPKRGYRLLQTPAEIEHEQAPKRNWFSRMPRLRKAAVGLGLILLAVVLEVGIERSIDGGGGEAPEIPEAAITLEDIERSIAVLPFVDMSAEQDQAYMGDGIAEELLNLLARIPDLRVISRSSSFSLRDAAIDLREVAQQFGVAYVLEGSVRTSGNRIRVTAQLVDGRTDTHVWSETYERDLDNVFAIQDAIAQGVAGKLRITILGDAPRSRPTDPDAYALFLQGRSLHEQPGGDAIIRALDFYQAALDIDPDYVPAWVWLAAAYDDVVNSIDLPREEVVQLAREAISRALDIDPEDPLALGMNAVLIQSWDHDVPRAAVQMQRALDLDPANPYLLRWSSFVFTHLGRHDEAVRVMEYLFERDPIGHITRINLASAYLSSGRFNEAVRLCEIEVALSTENSPCGWRLVLAHLYSGNAGSALELLERIGPSRTYTRLAPMVYFANEMSRPDVEQALTALMDAYEAGDGGLAYWIVNAYAFMGDEATMLAWLESTAEEGNLSMPPNTAYFSGYEDGPRFQRVLASLGMAPEELAGVALKLPPLFANP